jgi:acyl-CoA synthetase (AMP-forming)/AMP-acid ligase II
VNRVLALLHALRRMLWTTRILVASGMIAPMRPDKYLRQAAVIRRQGKNATTGISLSAVRSPKAVGLVDERGSLTWSELDRRCDAAAVALGELLGQRTGTLHRSGTVGILCRNHRGLVESLSASARIGADALLLNTGFSGPQLADVLERENAGLVVYDEEFAPLLEHARSKIDGLVEVLAWRDDHGAATGSTHALDALIDQHLGQRPPQPEAPGRTVLLTSGTTGTPKGARRSGGGAGTFAAILDRIPWRAGETTVVAAPMFHAWGFGQLAIAGSMACTVVMRRKFDPEAILELVNRHEASGLAVVPVMLERIIDLPDEVLDRYRLEKLRFVTASGSRMRPEAVTAFMDRFGDVVHNSYNATEAGLISTATAAELRIAPDTAGRPVVGTELRILDDQDREVPPGEVGRITVSNDSQFEGYTSGDTKSFHDNFMVSGDLGRVDEAGRLYVVGRDDEMIVSGGENVYPLEVEEILNNHDQVLEAAVIGVDDEKFGQRLDAYVVLQSGASVTPDDLKQHVKQQLAGYKVPRRVVVLDDLPRNDTGKVMKRQLTD